MKSYLKPDTEKYNNFKEKIEYLKDSTDPDYLIKELGFEINKNTSKEIRACCTIHNGDNPSAFRFNKETKTWVCFTNRCHDVHGNDIIGLVKAATGRDFLQAVEYLKQFAPDINDVDYTKFKRQKEIDDFIKSNNGVVVKPKSVSEESLSKFRYYDSDYFLRKGFKKSTLDYFEVGHGWVDQNDLIRSIIPIRDERGELVAYSLRDVRDIVDDFSKYILTPGFNKDNCLYNLHNAQEYATEMPLIVVEGFKSVWKLYEYGIKNVVAVMGSALTEGQQFLLCLYALSGIVLFFDNDKAGVKGITDAYNALSDKLDVRPVFIQEISEDGKGLDPADLSKEQIYEYLRTYF